MLVPCIQRDQGCELGAGRNLGSLTRLLRTHRSWFLDSCIFWGIRCHGCDEVPSCRQRLCSQKAAVGAQQRYGFSCSPIHSAETWTSVHGPAVGPRVLSPGFRLNGTLQGEVSRAAGCDCARRATGLSSMCGKLPHTLRCCKLSFMLGTGRSLAPGQRRGRGGPSQLMECSDGLWGCAVFNGTQSEKFSRVL